MWKQTHVRQIIRQCKEIGTFRDRLCASGSSYGGGGAGRCGLEGGAWRLCKFWASNFSMEFSFSHILSNLLGADFEITIKRIKNVSMNFENPRQMCIDDSCVFDMLKQIIILSRGTTISQTCFALLAFLFLFFFLFSPLAHPIESLLASSLHTAEG